MGERARDQARMKRKMQWSYLQGSVPSVLGPGGPRPGCQEIQKSNASSGSVPRDLIIPPSLSTEAHGHVSVSPGLVAPEGPSARPRVSSGSAWTFDQQS